MGTDVPNFEIDVYNPEEREFGKISLAELKAQKKWTVLVFYPADFTFVCPTELADLAEKHEAIRRMGAEVISVSTDTKYTHMAWRDAEKLLSGVKYLMGADPTRALSHLFGVYDQTSGLSLRGTFIINPEGKLVSSEVNYYHVGRENPTPGDVGIEDGTAPDDAAGIDHRIAADIGVIAEKDSELAEAGVEWDAVFFDRDVSGHEFDVGDFHAGAEMSFVTKDRIADVAEVRDLCVIEEEGVF